MRALELPRVVFFGRSGAEACRFFNLDLADWAGAGLKVLAIDPLYALDPEALERRCRDDIAFTMERLRRSPTVRPDFDLAPYHRDKLEALEAFLVDRQAHPASYSAGALPELPLTDHCFDLVLSGHLLFAYAPLADGGLNEHDDLDLAWHRRALAELLRVCRRELRIYPAHTITLPTRVQRETPRCCGSAGKALPRNGRNQPRRLQLGDEPEGGRIAEAIGEEHPIEVVTFVLDHPRVEALHRAIDRLAVGIHARVVQPTPARHTTTESRHAQAALPAPVALVPQGCEHRVDQHGAGDRRGVGIARVGPVAAEQHHPQGHADLGGGEAGAAAGHHGVVQIHDQLPHGRGVHIGHSHGDLAQAWITEPQHRQHRHCLEPFRTS